MERSLESIVGKIDAVLKGLEGMEKDKVKKRSDEDDQFKTVSTTKTSY